METQEGELIIYLDFLLRLEMLQYCDLCEVKMTIEHALSCKVGDLVHILHRHILHSPYPLPPLNLASPEGMFDIEGSYYQIYWFHIIHSNSYHCLFFTVSGNASKLHFPSHEYMIKRYLPLKSWMLT